MKNQTVIKEASKIRCDSADHVFEHAQKDDHHELTCVKCGKHLILPR